MVAVVTENGEILEVDCCYETCIHTPNCIIAKEIEGIDVVDKLLTLKGLKYLYDLNAKEE